MSWTCHERLPEEEEPATGGCFSIFAYRRSDAGGDGDLRRRRLPLDRLEQAVRWAADRGCDGIVIELDEAEPCFPDHHVCSDPACPGGCN